jgi:hypothetical protein
MEQVEAVVARWKLKGLQLVEPMSAPLYST